QFFLVGPNTPEPHPALLAQAQGGTIPNATPWLRAATMQYRPFGNPSRGPGLTVLLRRLANPYLPPNHRVTIDDRPNPLFNPYVTVDYLENVPLNLAGSGSYASRGKTQPYASHSSQSAFQQDEGVRAIQHTFGRRNNPLPARGHHDWLVHLDRLL